MQSENAWFSHDSNARNDRKIRALRAELGHTGYACYFMLLEVMRDEPTLTLDLSKGHIAKAVRDDLGLSNPQFDAFLRLCTDLELIQVVNQVVSSSSLMRRVGERMRIAQIWRDNGKKGGRPKKPTGLDLVNGLDNLLGNPIEPNGTERNGTYLGEKPKNNQGVFSAPIPEARPEHHGLYYARQADPQVIGLRGDEPTWRTLPEAQAIWNLWAKIPDRDPSPDEIAGEYSRIQRQKAQKSPNQESRTTRTKHSIADLVPKPEKQPEFDLSPKDPF